MSTPKETRGFSETPGRPSSSSQTTKTPQRDDVGCSTKHREHERTADNYDSPTRRLSRSKRVMKTKIRNVCIVEKALYGHGLFRTHSFSPHLSNVPTLRSSEEVGLESIRFG